MGLRLTEEQQAAVEVFAAGGDLALIAGAGTGKTSTLVHMGQAAGARRGLYLAFGRDIADEAERRFGPNVRCATAHAVAHRAVAGPYRHRLEVTGHVPSRVSAEVLGIRRAVTLDRASITPAHQARLALGMVRNFCYGTDEAVYARHLPRVNGLGVHATNYLARILLPYAERAWDDLCSPDGQLKFLHDHYLKMWALTRPTLAADFVLLDEAQDTNPVLEQVFLAQGMQRVCVGDPAQQIYAWRHARDVMTAFPAAHLYLTRSFRFGPEIAEVANQWLRHAGSDLRLTGHGEPSRLAPAPDADAVLCRGNADALAVVLDCLGRGIPVALAGGGKDMRRIAQAAIDLKAGRRTSHPDLFLFKTWQEVQEYADQDDGQALRSTVRLIDTHGADCVLDAVERLADESHARVTVSTVHKAKGREWPSVRVGGGFPAPVADADGVPGRLRAEEARLIYVAVTRARVHLDRAAVAWIDRYEAEAHQARLGLVGGRPLIDLSLTGQLRYPGSPVSRFMDAHLPHHGRIVAQLRTGIARLPEPIQPVDVPRPAWAELGHAIDYRLRLSLGRGLGPAVSAGVQMFAAPAAMAVTADAASALHGAGRELLRRLGHHLDGRGTLPDVELDRLCFAAAWFEDAARRGTISHRSPLTSATAETTLDALLAAVPAYVSDDLGAQMALAAAPFASYRRLPAEQRICGPVFAGSGDIGGADADFILGGTLIDCKATTRPAVLGQAEVYQLAGYLLLDYDDRYGIRSVGLYLSRQGALTTWPVDRFLALLGSGLSLPRLRDLMREHLRAARTASVRSGMTVNPFDTATQEAS